MIFKLTSIGILVMLLPLAHMSGQSVSDGEDSHLSKEPSDWIRSEYEKEFSLFFETREFGKKCVSVSKQLDNRDAAAIFYMAGFIRGCREYRAYQAYRRGVGLGKIDIRILGRNAAEEMRGWLAGCQFGRLQGDRIVRMIEDRMRAKLLMKSSEPSSPGRAANGRVPSAQNGDPSPSQPAICPKRRPLPGPRKPPGRSQKRSQ